MGGKVVGKRDRKRERSERETVDIRV